jgi:MORN repeat
MYTFPDGSKYVGEFGNDKFNGLGTLTSRDGTKYVGEFRDGKYNGRGTLTKADGNTVEGEFANGLYIGLDINNAAKQAPDSQVEIIAQAAAHGIAAVTRCHLDANKVNARIRSFVGNDDSDYDTGGKYDQIVRDHLADLDSLIKEHGLGSICELLRFELHQFGKQRRIQ